MSLHNSIVITGGGGMLAHAFDEIFRESGRSPSSFLTCA